MPPRRHCKDKAAGEEESPMGSMARMFNPVTIALVGATDKDGAVGRTIIENLASSPKRRIFPVNPKRETVLGIACYKTIQDVPEHVDLAVIAVPAEEVPRCVDECGMAGVEGAIIVSAGFREVGPRGRELEEQVVAARKKHGMRIIGPNCLGIMRPNLDLNATLIKDAPEKGHIAFITESEGFGRVLLDWGISAGIGFSMFASLGSMVDVDFGDLIDFLGEDPYTRSIILYIEGPVGDVRRFISATKGFARNKPIIVLRPQPTEDYSLPAKTHTGVMAVGERVYNAVFKRIGAVRVREAGDVFSIAGVLYSRRLPKGPRLLIITNAGGIGVMATHTLREFGGELAVLSRESLEALDSVLPSFWNRANPVNLLRDADVGRFTRSIEIGLQDPGVDGLLVICTPQGAATSEEVARAVSEMAERTEKPVITSFMGGRETLPGKEILRGRSLPTYDTPEEAVKTYLYMYRYERNLQLLHETPSELAVDHAPPKNNLKSLIIRAQKEDRLVLTGEDGERFLANYGIPTVRTYVVQTVEEALYRARLIGYPVVLKVLSADVIDRIDVGGVMTDISTDEELGFEFDRLRNRVKENAPAVRMTGMSLQRMVEKIDYELILGAKKDAQFGTVIVFGMGGVGVHIFNDFSVALPPLNQTLARRLMEETRVYKILQGYRGKPPADLRQLEEIIVAFSNMIVDFPEIAEMDINPVVVSNGKAYALDARIVLEPTSPPEGSSPYSHLVITPYPTRYIMHWTLVDGTEVVLRPIRPEDEPLEHEMLTTLSEETLRTRFFQAIRNITHEMHVRFCNIDYDREIAIVAEIREGERKRFIGMGRLIVESSLKRGEYAVLVHDDFHGKGLGYKLIDVLIGIAQDKGLEEFFGYVQAGNSKMLRVCKRLGFTVQPFPDHINKVTLMLK